MIKKWIYKLRYILIIFSALLWILGLSSSFWAVVTAPKWQILYPWSNNWYSEWLFVNSSMDFNTYVWGASLGYNSFLALYSIYYSNSPNIIWYLGDRLYMFYRYNWNNCAWNIIQWYVNKISVCDGIIGDNHYLNLWSCYTSMDYTFDRFKRFYTLSSDWWFWYINNWSCYKWAFCFNSADFTGFYCLFADTEDSLDYSYTDFSTYNDAWEIFYKSVSWGGGWDWGNSWGGALWEVEITNGMVIKNYANMGWNKAICYAWYWSGWQLVSPPWTWYSVFDLYDTYNPLWFSEITEWYDYYRYWFQDNPNIAITWSVFAWDWVFHASLHSLFAMWYKNGVWVLFPSADIIEYCDLIINSDYNAVYTWTLTETEKTIITNNYYTNTYYTNAFDFDYTWAISTLTWFGEDFSWDIFDKFKDLSKRFQNWLWQMSWNLVGIVPNYILVFLFALIFIRILRK